MLSRIQVTRERASKLSSQRAANEAAFLDKTNQRHAMQMQLEQLRQSHMVKRNIAEINKNQNIKLNTIQRNELLSGKNQEKERFSQLRK
jgi:hypothetical protein